MANSSDGDAVDLVSAVGDEVEDEAHLAEFLGEGPHLVVGHAGGVPVERRGQVVGHHLVGEFGMDRVGELPGVGEIGGLRLHPEDVGERRGGQRLGDRIRDAAAHLVVALRRLGAFAVPRTSAPSSLAFSRAVYSEARLGELPPLGGVHVERFALALAEIEQLGHRLAVGLSPASACQASTNCDSTLSKSVVDRLLRAVLPGGSRLGDRCRDAVALQPGVGGGVFAVGKCVEQMTASAP